MIPIIILMKNVYHLTSLTRNARTDCRYLIWAAAVSTLPPLGVFLIEELLMQFVDAKSGPFLRVLDVFELCDVSVDSVSDIR